ncbi:MAG: chemotaxis protein CheW [Thermoanaerobaculia bacterium]
MGRSGFPGASGALSAPVVIVDVDAQRYGLPLASVERVERAVEITPLPNAPEIVIGVISIRDRVVPVFDFRRRLRIPSKEIALEDQMVLARAGARLVALLVDRVSAVVGADEAARIAPEEVLPDLRHVAGIVKMEGGLVVIHDLDAFLSAEEEARLERALRERPKTT